MSYQEKQLSNPELVKKRRRIPEKIWPYIDASYFLVDNKRAEAYLRGVDRSRIETLNVHIPLGKHGGINYWGIGATGGVTDRAIGAYQTMLFPEEFELEKTPKGEFSVDYFLQEALEKPGAQKVFGGYHEAFREGKVVLDIASGQALAGMQLAIKHPQTTFIGIDRGYEETRKVFTSRYGLQLTQDDWHKLAQIPDGSVDTILSVQGLSMWGLPRKPTLVSGGNEITEEQGMQIVRALNRVSKRGTVIRLDGDNQFIKEKLQGEWDIYTSDQGNGIQRFIAKKK